MSHSVWLSNVLTYVLSLVGFTAENKNVCRHPYKPMASLYQLQISQSVKIAQREEKTPQLHFAARDLQPALAVRQNKHAF